MTPLPLPLPELWAAMLATYGHRWASAFGQQPDGVAAATWATGLAGLTGAQVSDGLRRCLTHGDGWPPTLPEFRRLCLGIPDIAAVRRELRDRDSRRSPFTLLAWSFLDAYAWRCASSRDAERMLVEAYAMACEAVMDGKPLPAAAPEVEHQGRPAPTPASPDQAARHMRDIAEALRLSPDEVALMGDDGMLKAGEGVV